MSFPVNIGRNRWQEALSEMIQGGAGLVGATANNFYQNGIAPGLGSSQQRPIPNPQFQTTIPGQPGFMGQMVGNQGRTINHPVQQYQGQIAKSFMDQLLGRNPNRPAPGTVVLPGPALNGDAMRATVQNRLQNANWKGGGSQAQPQQQNPPPQGRVADPVQMDQMPPERAQQVQQRQTGGNTPQFTGGSFQNMATQAAQQKADGQQLPFQGLNKPEDIRRSFNNASGTGGERLTSYDTDKVYAIVRNLEPEDYAQLESYTTRSDLVEASSDTALDLLEENQIYMSDGLEERFKAGIGAAMEDWYARQVESGKATDMTSYMMGMTQFALALIDEAGETNAQAMGRQPVAYQPQGDGAVQTQPPLQFTGEGGLPTEEEFYAGLQSGAFSPEIIEGFKYFMEQNPGVSYDEFIRGSFR